MWVVQCRAHGEIVGWNPALERLLAQGRRQPDYLWELIDPRDRQIVHGFLDEALNGARETITFQSLNPVNGKTMWWVLWRTAAISEKHRTVLAIAAEPPEHSESQADDSGTRMEVMGRLAAGLAHDFNNVLTGILLYCDLLTNALEPGHRARKYAEEVRSAALQASGLVRQLLSVARRNDSDAPSISMNAVADDLHDLLTRLIGEKIELRLQLDPDLGLIRMDASQAQQVVLNLVLNARDAMPGGGFITVETSNCQIQVFGERAEAGATTLPCVLLAVSDNGTGIDESTRAHLFEAFFTTKGKKGTGLGLTTVRDIVRRNGGLLHVHSTVGSGTRVSVLLPLISEEDTVSQDVGNARSELEEINSAFIKEQGTI